MHYKLVQLEHGYTIVLTHSNQSVFASAQESVAVAKLEELNTLNPPAWSGRCNCYRGHNSSSGRCTCRPVEDTTRYYGESAICESCRANCGHGNGIRNA